MFHFCKENELSLKVILLLDNAPGHSQNITEIRTPLNYNIIYMSQNTISILQPMDQGVIITFKSYYFCTTFKGMASVLDSIQ